MQQAEYNAKVQDMQRFCISAGLQHRVRPVYVSSVIDDKVPELSAARFEVFYGDWRLIGEQTYPMQPTAAYFYREDQDTMLRAEVARDLSQ